tara:strand:- start:218 stop:583 length:366 start_codon:yes stop_codon:yes gene_type:complete
MSKYSFYKYIDTPSGEWEGNMMTVIHSWKNPETGEDLIYLPYLYFKEMHGWTEAQFLEEYKPYMWEEIREKRDALLLETDWTQNSDVPEATKAKWQTYRQALRDVPSQSDPYNITWPTKPS